MAGFKNFGFCFAFRLLIRNFADAILFLWISVIIYIVAGVGCAEQGIAGVLAYSRRLLTRW